MRELRSCDFCGGDAAGTFEIVPPELEPTEAEQRRVVLCGQCKARLEALLEPLLARAGVDVGTGTTASRDVSDTADSKRARTSSRSERTTDSVPGSGDEIDRAGTETGAGTVTGAETESETDSPTGITVEPSDSTTVDPTDSVSGRQSARESERESVDRGDDGGSDGETDLEDEAEQTGISSSEPDASAVDSSESRDETSTANSSSNAGGSRTRAESGSGSGSESESGPESASDSGPQSGSQSPTHSPPAAETEAPPRAYRKVVRLLRNREFPMDRAAVESLAAGAYDLENDEVEAIVDHAIARGEFRADGEQLQRP